MALSLKERRLKKNLTQQQLALKSGISRPTIIGIERNGPDGVTVQTLQQLADALDCKVKDLV